MRFIDRHAKVVANSVVDLDAHRDIGHAF